MSTNNSNERRQTPLERYLSVLEVVAASNRNPTLTELSELMHLPKPTVHRLVGVLENAGALESSEGRQRSFRIGRRMWRILQLGQSLDTVTNFAQMACDRLTDTVRETSYIVKLGVDAVHTVTRSVPDQGYRLHVFPGEELPAHAAASAKSIMAYQAPEVVDRILREPLKALTRHTITQVDTVKQHLVQVRDQGYAVCDKEIDDDIMAYACPVHLPDAGVLYSVGVTAPCSRLNREPADYWITHLQETARYFARLLTHTKPEPDEPPRMR